MSKEKFFGSFLCIVAMIMIISFEFITDIIGISRYMEKDRNGIINNIIISVSMIIFAVPVFILSRYARIE